MRYGVPYQGSKSRICKEIVDLLPAGDYFIDLFAGGCAVTHAALLSGKWKFFLANDIGSGPELFRDAIAGKYAGETRWISRSDFYAEKDQDPYIKYCWSFSNSGEEYLYSVDREEIKRLHHMAMISTDLNQCKSAFSAMLRKVGEKVEETVKLLEYCKTREYLQKIDLAEGELEGVKRYLREAKAAAGLTDGDIMRHMGNFMARHYFSNSQWELPTREAYEKLQEIMDLPVPWEDLAQKKNCLQSLQSLQRLQSLQSLQTSRKDYREVDIPPGAIVYCDIPYSGRAGYGDGVFDYVSFFQWAREVPFPVYISEYAAPEDFRPVWKKKIRNLKGGGRSTRMEEECIFLHEKWPVHEQELLL